MKDSRLAISFPVEGQDSLAEYFHRLDLFFEGASSNVTPQLVDRSHRRYNFYEQYSQVGVLGVTGGRCVIYENIYPHIDFHIYSNRWGPKMYIVVRPGGDPARIKMKFSGHDQLLVENQELLKIIFGEKHIKLEQAYAYQQQGQATVELPWMAEYFLAANDLYVTLSFGDYDEDLPLIFVIQPLQPDVMPAMGGQPEPPEWCSFVAGTQDDDLADLDHDQEGYVYFTGKSRSGNTELPISPGAAQPILGGGTDVILGRFNEYYEIETQDTWMTYVGGVGNDAGTDLAFDEFNGRLAVVGSFGDGTAFQNIPLNGDPDCYQRMPFTTMATFLLFADPATGLIDYFTRTPGATNYEGLDVDCDDSGNTYVVGAAPFMPAADLANNPTGAFVINSINESDLEAYINGFLIQLDANAHLSWATLLGGAKRDIFNACRFDPVTQRLYLVGMTTSAHSPTANCTVNANLQVVFPTCDPQLDGYFQYARNGGIFPPTPGVADGFIMAFNTGTRTLFWSSFFGALGDDRVWDVAVDGQGRVYIAGGSYPVFYNSAACAPPITSGGFPKCDAGGFFLPGDFSGDRFLARFETDTKLTWSSKYGGESTEYNAYPSRITCSTSNELILLDAVRWDVPAAPPIPSEEAPGYYSDQTHQDEFMAGGRDVYVAVFDPATEVVTGTYFGGIGVDRVGGVTAPSGRLYISGSTNSLFNFGSMLNTVGS